VPESNSPAVVREGKTLAKGVVLSFSGTFTEAGLAIGGELVRAYFDAGLYRPGSDDPQYVALGYALCPVQGGVVQPAVATHAYIDTLANILRQGGLRLERLSPEDRAQIAASPVSRGNEMWDLVAAFLALARLKEVRYAGRVEGRTDNQSVIRFLNEPDAHLALRVGQTDISRELLAEIWESARGFSGVEWIWIPREENIADPLIKERLNDHIRGFRKGETVQEISDRRAGARGTAPPSS